MHQMWKNQVSLQIHVLFSRGHAYISRSLDSQFDLDFDIEKGIM